MLNLTEKERNKIAELIPALVDRAKQDLRAKDKNDGAHLHESVGAIICDLMQVCQLVGNDKANYAAKLDALLSIATPFIDELTKVLGSDIKQEMQDSDSAWNELTPTDETRGG